MCSTLVGITDSNVSPFLRCLALSLSFFVNKYFRMKVILEFIFVFEQLCGKTGPLIAGLFASKQIPSVPRWKTDCLHCKVEDLVGGIADGFVCQGENIFSFAFLEKMIEESKEIHLLIGPRLQKTCLPSSQLIPCLNLLIESTALCKEIR